MFNVKTNQIVEQASDVLVFGVFDGKSVATDCFSKVDQAMDGKLAPLLADEEAGKHKSLLVVPSFGQIAAKKIMFVGLGKIEEADDNSVKKAIGHAVKELLHKLKAKNVSICFESFLHNDEHVFDTAYTIAESVKLAAYAFDNYKTADKKTQQFESIDLVVCKSDQAEVEQGLSTGAAYAEGAIYARNLVNAPGNKMTPTILASHAADIATRHGFELTVLEKRDMEELGMGALLGVAQGSDEPPKMIVIKYQGRDTWDNVLGLVGKGLTFDTGGVSIKPAQGMHEMKMDMGGGAAVLGAMEIIGQLKPKTNVLAVIPSTENMLNGKAMKPGDVLHSLSGKTIEVRNTDAEGRLILADGITYAKQLGANYLVDVATLTGAVIIALGHYNTGAVTNHEDFMIEVLEAAEDAGENVWRLPNNKEYIKLIKSSDVADLNNSPGRPAGSITAGLFLGEFAEDTPWVHLDIAGTAYTNEGDEVTPKGGTGVMARTLAALAVNREA